VPIDLVNLFLHHSVVKKPLYLIFPLSLRCTKTTLLSISSFISPLYFTSFSVNVFLYITPLCKSSLYLKICSFISGLSCTSFFHKSVFLISQSVPLSLRCAVPLYLSICSFITSLCKTSLILFLFLYLVIVLCLSNNSLSH
jgi:hypothetical protein